MYKFYATGIGSLITIMIMVNSVFAEQAGYIISIIVIHLVGLLVSSVIVLFYKKPHSKQPTPIYLYFSGIVGVFVLFSNNYCFQTLGASLTLSLGLLGQSIGAIIIDKTGFLGMKKHVFSYKKLIGIFLMLVGILVMVEEVKLNILFMILALITGGSVILTMVLNTRLAHFVGLFKGTQVNYIVGTISMLIVVLIWQANLTDDIKVLSSINPIILLGGGLLGVCVVASINYVLPNIPTFHGTILIFLGQICTGLAIDYLISDLFSIQKFIGAIIVFTGLISDHFSGFYCLAKLKSFWSPHRSYSKI